MESHGVNTGDGCLQHPARSFGRIYLHATMKGAHYSADKTLPTVENL